VEGTLANLKAVVLAAGEGSRIWPLAEDRPKHLLPVGGKSILSHILQALSENSVTDVLVVVGFKNEQIRSSLGDGGRYGVHVDYLDQKRWTGTASALRIAYDAVGKERFLAVYGDLLVDASAIQTVLDKAEESTRVMGVVRVPNPSEYGVVKLEADRVVKIVEKPERGLAEGWINTGIYVLDEEVFQAIDKIGVSKRREYELTSSLQRIVDEGKELKAAIIAREDWMDIGRPWDLLEANVRCLTLLPHRVKGTVEQGCTLKGPIWLEENASIKSGSYVEGPVYVGSGSKIGPNARIRPSTSIGDNVTIGTSCEVKNSIIMNGTLVPHLSYVGDSIICENCNLAAGTITANIRFDQEPIQMRIKGRKHNTGRNKVGAIIGDHVQTGINVSIMPGVRIGSNSWIGPGVVVEKDVPSGSGIFLHQSTVTKRRNTSTHK
jgi:bifunctional UDP-N-acetylglucosamine pyrophosphorylase/glucosamine-1-phosphate N-acetyltransferase